MRRVAVLDDYQDVALQMADWNALPSDTKVQVFRDHLSNPEAVAERLKDFDIVAVMRERTPFPRSLLERLPKLKLLVTTGMRHASIDVAAALDVYDEEPLPLDHLLRQLQNTVITPHWGTSRRKAIRCFTAM
jgi:phosphoglycerate dehydrogenase-like enzyme